MRKLHRAEERRQNEARATHVRRHTASTEDVQLTAVPKYA